MATASTKFTFLSLSKGTPQEAQAYGAKSCVLWQLCHTKYPDIIKYDGPLRHDILLANLKTSAADLLSIHFPLSENTVVVNLEIPISFEKEVIVLPHSTGTWFMLVNINEVQSLEPQLKELDYYFRDKKTKQNFYNKFVFNTFLKKVRPNNQKEIVVNLITMIKVTDASKEYKELIGNRDNLVFTVEKFKRFKFSDLQLPENSIIIAQDLSVVQPIDENYFDNVTDITACDVDKDELATYVAVYDIFSPTASLVAKRSSFFMDGCFTAFLVDPALILCKKYDKGIRWTPTLLVKESDSNMVVKYLPK
ncbi:1345_t:CDS:2, partial [Paraglomus brasilianum]